MNATVTAGPDRSAIAAAVRTNRPAPIMAPMPRATSDVGPRVRLSASSPAAAASNVNCSIGFVPKIDISALAGLYQAVKILADPADRITGREQVCNHSHRRGASIHDVRHSIERDASNG